MAGQVNRWVFLSKVLLVHFSQHPAAPTWVPDRRWSWPAVIGFLEPDLTAVEKTLFVHGCKVILRQKKLVQDLASGEAKPDHPLKGLNFSDVEVWQVACETQFNFFTAGFLVSHFSVLAQKLSNNGLLSAKRFWIAALRS